MRPFFVRPASAYSSSVEAETANNYLPAYEKIRAFDYFDLNASWQVLKHLKINTTINNVFDKQPPIIGTGTGTGTGIGAAASNFGNTMLGVYDVIGRRYTISATATF